MLKLRSIVIGAMVVAGLAILAGCGSSSSSSSGSTSSSGTSASSGSPFIDLVDVDKTGPTKVYGLPELAGVEAAAKLVNEKEGGILGHKIVVKSINDNGDPQTGISALISYLGSNPKPNNFYPGAESTLEGALIPVAGRKGLFMAAKGDGENLFAPANDPHKNYPLGFQATGSVTPLNESIAEFFKQKGIKKVGILEGEYAYAEGEIPIITGALKKLGIASTVVKASLTATSVAPEMDQLKSSGAEALYVALVGASSNYAFAARAQLGWNVPLVGEGSFSGTDLTKTVPASQRKNAYVTLFPDTPSNTTVPGVGALKSAIGGAKLEAFGVPLDVVALGWDTVVILKNAAKKANSIEPTKMAEALETGGEFTDPLMAMFSAMKFSTENHENFAPTSKDFPVVAVGPFKEGQLQVSGG
jgi:branched-chain amino acid transport system substrate-binding protein